jgi:hypothetical protein
LLQWRFLLTPARTSLYRAPFAKHHPGRFTEAGRMTSARYLAIRLLLAMWTWRFVAFVAVVALLGWLSGYDVR